MGNALGVATISTVVQSGRSEVLALRKRIARSTSEATMSRETFEAAEQFVGIDESDRDIYDRLFTLYDKRGGGEVVILEFLAGLATIANCTLEERVHIACEVFDSAQKKNPGYLTRSELKQALNAMNRCCAFFGDPPISCDQINELVESVFATFAKDDLLFHYREHACDVASHPVIDIFLAANA